MAGDRLDPYYPNIKPQYSEIGRSVYGSPDFHVVEHIKRIHGPRILEVGAGDGKYTIGMLEDGKEVVAGDISVEPLNFLRRRAKINEVNPPQEVVFDAFRNYPFVERTFDGVVCTGLVYLYPPEMISRFFEGARRVLRDGSGGHRGTLVFDFATDIERRKDDGSLERGPTEVNYSLEEGKKILPNLLKESGFRDSWFTYTSVSQDLRSSLGYVMSNKKINVVAWT